MTEIEPEELGPEIRPHPTAERVWQHPSEVGLESRCRVDQRRSGWIAGSVLLAVLALLGTGFALGTTRPMQMSEPRQLPEQEPSKMSADRAATQQAWLKTEFVAEVTIISLAASTVATALRFDPKGHLLLPAHLLAPDDEVWAACADGSQEQLEIIATDPASDLAVLRPIRPSSGTSVATAEFPKATQQVTVFYADPILGVTARVGHLAAGDSGTAADQEGSLHAELGAQIRPLAPVAVAPTDAPTDAPTGAAGQQFQSTAQPADPEMLTGGLVFDPDGAFIGITTLTESRPTSSTTTWVVEILVADTALGVAGRLLRS